MSWEGQVVLGKGRVRVELDPKEPQQSHLAGGQGGAQEGCTDPPAGEVAASWEWGLLPGTGSRNTGTHPAQQTSLTHQSSSMLRAHPCPRSPPEAQEGHVCDTSPPLACPSCCVASSLSFPSDHVHTGYKGQKNWSQGLAPARGSPPPPTSVPSPSHKPQLPWAVSKH